VLARDIQTGRQKVVEMKSAVDVDDAAVQQMVEESVEHAFEDLGARQWIEAKLRAEEIIAAARKGLIDCVDSLDPAGREQIESTLSRVEAALATENPETQVGDINLLKSATTALDEATGSLADLMMDRAMETLLRKRGLIQ
jgi:molecular chaperone DnaK